MKVLYFSSTGNCLYVAKELGGELFSIPKMIEENKYVFEDECIGIVFPIYGLCVPPFIVEYLKKVEFKCNYLFAIATYGFFSGAACGQLQEIKLKNGKKFDYIHKLKMAENCITFSDMSKQEGDSENQQKHLQAIIQDIKDKKSFVKSDILLGKIMTKQHQKNYEFETGVGIIEDLLIEEGCVGCLTCERVCPMNNIHFDKAVTFGKNCISCGACIQNCPKKVIHHKKEKSGERYRNPHITLEELMYK